MSLKKLLGLNNANITDCELMARIREAQMHNEDVLEFEIDGQIIKMKLPNIAFDAHLFSGYDSW